MVSYHRTNTAIAVFYSVLCCLSGRCFLKNAPHFDSIILSLGECTVRSGGTRQQHVCFSTSKWQDYQDSRDSLGTVFSETVTTVALSAPPTMTSTHMPYGITVLPDTRWRWESRLYPQPKRVLDLATPEGCKAELTYVTWKRTGRDYTHDLKITSPTPYD